MDTITTDGPWDKGDPHLIHIAELGLPFAKGKLLRRTSNGTYDDEDENGNPMPEVIIQITDLIDEQMRIRNAGIRYVITINKEAGTIHVLATFVVGHAYVPYGTELSGTLRIPTKLHPTTTGHRPYFIPDYGEVDDVERYSGEKYQAITELSQRQTADPDLLLDCRKELLSKPKTIGTDRLIARLEAAIRNLPPSNFDPMYGKMSKPLYVTAKKRAYQQTDSICNIGVEVKMPATRNIIGDSL